MNPVVTAAFFDELQKIAEDKHAGWLSSILGKGGPDVAGTVASLGNASRGGLLAHGVEEQMKRKANRFGGAAVDPFVKMQKLDRLGTSP